MTGMIGALMAVAALAAGSTPSWNAPPDPIALTRKAGLTPETHEFVFLHVHSHLDVLLNGKKIRVPAGIGIDIHASAVKRFQAPDGTIGYGGISPACTKPCISPLHTHFDDGILHTEAKKHEFNKLAQFFTEWNVRLTRRCVASFCKPKTKIAVYIDGTKFTGDPRAIELKDKREIAIVIGRKPSHIPSVFP
jgi:hypothetical protein